MTDKCLLLTGTFAYVIQILLGIAAGLSLVFKRHIEKPQRPWIIWAFDVGKQIVGGGFVHFSNILVSAFLEGSVEDDDSDQCAWYFLNFFIDCTLGVFIVYLAHSFLCRLGKYINGPESVLAHIGEYGDPPALRVWGIQLGVWLVALLLNKLLVLGLFYSTREQMNKFGNWLFGPVQDDPQTELVIVMVACPWFLTMLQYWCFDRFLKAQGVTSADSSGLLSEQIDSTTLEQNHLTERMVHRQAQHHQSLPPPSHSENNSARNPMCPSLSRESQTPKTHCSNQHQLLDDCLSPKHSQALSLDTQRDASCDSSFYSANGNSPTPSSTNGSMDIEGGQGS